MERALFHVHRKNLNGDIPYSCSFDSVQSSVLGDLPFKLEGWVQMGVPQGPTVPGSLAPAAVRRGLLWGCFCLLPLPCSGSVGRWGCGRRSRSGRAGRGARRARGGCSGRPRSPGGAPAAGPARGGGAGGAGAPSVTPAVPQSGTAALGPAFVRLKGCSEQCTSDALPLREQVSCSEISTVTSVGFLY